MNKLTYIGLLALSLLFPNRSYSNNNPNDNNDILRSTVMIYNDISGESNFKDLIINNSEATIRVLESIQNNYNNNLENTSLSLAIEDYKQSIQKHDPDSVITTNYISMLNNIHNNQNENQANLPHLIDLANTYKNELIKSSTKNKKNPSTEFENQLTPAKAYLNMVRVSHNDLVKNNNSTPVTHASEEFLRACEEWVNNLSADYNHHNSIHTAYKNMADKHAQYMNSIAILIKNKAEETRLIDDIDHINAIVSNDPNSFNKQIELTNICRTSKKYSKNFKIKFKNENHSEVFDKINQEFAQSIYDSYKKIPRSSLIKIYEEDKISKPNKFYKEDGNILRINIQPQNQRPTAVKIIRPNSYDGPKTKDFHDRLNIIAKTAEDYLNNTKSTNINDPVNYDKEKHEIFKLLKFYGKQIDINANLNWAKVNQEMESGIRKEFNEKFKNGKKIIQDFTKNISTILSEATRTAEKPFKGGSDFEEYEGIYTSKIGRPNLFNIYEITSNNRTSQFISAQRPFEKLSNSSVQTSVVRNQNGLSNAVETSFYRIDQKQKVIPLFSAYRHSSYSPIKIYTPKENKLDEMNEDDIKRRSFAMSNMKDMLEHLVNNYKNANDGNCPKTVPLSSMMLITAERSQWEKLRGFQSEMRQLEESYFVSRMFDGRKIKVNGCKDDITINTSFMNIGANKLSNGTLGKTLNDKKFQNKINAKGFYEFNSSIKDFFKLSTELFNKNSNKILLNYNKNQINELNSLKSILNELNNTYSIEDPSIPELKIQIQTLSESLKLDYKNIQEAQEAYNDGLLRNTDAIKDLYGKISLKETELQKTYRVIENIQKFNYLKNEIKIRNKEEVAINKINDLIEILRENNTIYSDLIKSLDQQRDVLRAYSDAKKIYYKEDYTNRLYRLDFQKNYLLANYKVGNNVEFFCKSGEDRTGRLNNKIEEMLAFKALYGHLPSYDNPNDRKIIKRIAARVYHGGSSRDANGMNVRGARGLQIDDDEDYGVRGSIENAMAKLAKDAFYEKPLFQIKKLPIN